MCGGNYGRMILGVECDFTLHDRLQAYQLSGIMLCCRFAGEKMKMVKTFLVWEVRGVDGDEHNPGMLIAEQTKYRKHEIAYAHTGCSFVALICSYRV